MKPSLEGQVVSQGLCTTKALLNFSIILPPASQWIGVALQFGVFTITVKG